MLRILQRSGYAWTLTGLRPEWPDLGVAKWRIFGITAIVCTRRVFVVSLELDAQDLCCFLSCFAHTHTQLLLNVVSGIATLSAYVAETKPLLIRDGQRGVRVFVPQTLCQEFVPYSLERATKRFYNCRQRGAFDALEG